MEPFPPIDWQATIQVDDPAALQNAIDNAHNSGIPTRIELENNILLNQPLIVPERTKIYFTSVLGPPHVIDATGQNIRIMEIHTDIDPNYSTAVYFGNIIIRGGRSTMDGGAIYSTGPGYAIVALEPGASFEDNTAINGGAIALTRGSVGVFGGILHNNRADHNGGAVYIATGRAMPYGAFKMNMDSSLIYRNEAGINGGGVYVGSIHEVTIEGGTIENNIAHVSGGGLYVHRLTMSAGNILNNNADVGGGGIFLNGRGTITGSAGIVGNTAPGGGGIYLGRNDDVRLDIYNDARITNNHATGDDGGGGIFLTHAQLPLLTVALGVRFEANTALQGFANRLPADDAIYLANIHGTLWTSPFIQGYNNVDIRYDGENPPPPPGCQVDGHQMIDICLPVTVTPYCNVGEITTRCCGAAVITPGTLICPGTPLGDCNFTIQQRICVNVPVDFGATVQPGVPHIITTDEDCTGCDDDEGGGA